MSVSGEQEVYGGGHEFATLGKNMGAIARGKLQSLSIYITFV